MAELGPRPFGLSNWFALLLTIGLTSAATAQVPDYHRPTWRKVQNQQQFDQQISSSGLCPGLSAGATCYVYLRQNQYMVDNPIIVDRPLYLHGSTYARTLLLANDPDAPMFKVVGSNKINIAGIELGAKREHDCVPGDPCQEGVCLCFQPPCPPPPGTCPAPLPVYEPNQVAIEFEECEECGSSTRLEMFDSSLSRTSLKIGSGGLYQLQNTIVFGSGHMNAPILVDHPDARFVHVGGTYGGDPYLTAPFPLEVPGPYYHVWQKRGRVELYGVLTVFAYGNADFRFDTGAEGGPHVVAGVRSEGINDNHVPSAPSLVYVPPSDEAVDLLVVANQTGWDRANGGSHFVDYNAAGTVWLFSNDGQLDVDRLVVGDAPQATIVALANASLSPDLLPGSTDVRDRWVNAARKILAGNLYNWVEHTGCEGGACGAYPHPVLRLVDPTRSISSYPYIPRVPTTIGPPSPLVRPKIGAAIPGMLDVTKCGANPAAGNDDTAAIERAFQFAASGTKPAGCSGDIPDIGVVYFPKGTYDLTRPLLWQFPEYSAQTDKAWVRAWIAGAGGDCEEEPTNCSMLRNDGSIQGQTKQGVLYIASLHASTIQDLHFKGEPFALGEQTEELATVATVQLEYQKEPVSNLEDLFPTQSNSFHDCVFDGGKYAFGTALVSQVQTDSTMMVRSKFRNAKVGFAQAGHNAFGNVIYDVDAGPTAPPTFEDNHYAVGAPDTQSGCTSGDVPCCGNPVLGEQDTLFGLDAAWCPGQSDNRALPCVPVLEHACTDPNIPCGPAGTYHIIGAQVRGTKTHDIRSGGGPSFFHRLDTDSEVLHNGCDPGSNGSLKIQFFHRAKLAHTESARPMFDWRSGGGPFFLGTETVGTFHPPIFQSNSLSPGVAFNLDATGSNTRLWRGLRKGWAWTTRDYRLEERHWVECGEGHPTCNDGLACTDDSCCADESTTTTCSQAGSDAYCRYAPNCPEGTDPLNNPVNTPCTLDVCEPCDSVAEDGCAPENSWCINQTSMITTEGGQLAPTFTAHEYNALHDFTCHEGLCPGTCSTEVSDGCTLGTGPFCPSCAPESSCGEDCWANSNYECSLLGARSCASTDSALVCSDVFHGDTGLRLIVGCSGTGLCALTEQSVACGCQANEQCGDDGKYCSGVKVCEGSESCTKTCVDSTPPCAAARCDERADTCVVACPEGNFCAPTSTGSVVDVGTALCAATTGAILGCPEGQTIHTNSHDCDVATGPPSWFCLEPAP